MFPDNSENYDELMCPNIDGKNGQAMSLCVQIILEMMVRQSVQISMVKRYRNELMCPNNS